MKKSENPKISIIVPIYNTERYLPRCIDSLLGQSFQDFEVLLIDDGSRDRSGEICDEYTIKDKRVRAFHQENQGVSVARNVGIENALGEWIYFPDSDDVLMPGAFEMMMRLTNENTDYIMCGYEVYDEDGQCTYAISEKKQQVKSKHDAIMEMFWPTDYRYQGYLWNKLYKTSIIKEYSMAFTKGIKFNEDRLFNVQYLCHINGDVAYTTSPIYQYIERSTGAMASLTQRFNPDFLTDLDAFVMMKEPLSESRISNDLWEAYANVMYYSVCRYYSMCQQFGKLSIDKILAVEKRLLCGVGLGKYLQFRMDKLIRKIKRICKNS